MAAPPRAGAAGHGDSLRRVVARVATGAERGEEALVGGIVAEMRHVQQAVGLAAALANVTSSLKDGEAQSPPAGIVKFPVLPADGHGG